VNRNGFVHQALCYGSDAEFLEGTAEFARDGLDAGDTVLAVVQDHNISLLREALGDRAREVEFTDAADWYGYPSRTLGRYHAYCAGQPDGRRVRIVGEPVWSGRTAFETREWTRYESLLNVAFAGTRHWILCPYDTRTLPGGVLRAALGTHPELALGPRQSAPSGHYADPVGFSAECDARAPAPLPAGPDDIRFARGHSAAVRHALAAYARRLGIPERRTYDMVSAVHETVVNALRYGGGHGVVRLRSDPDYLICEISAGGAHSPATAPPFPGQLPPEPSAAGGHGMWLVRQLSDLMTARLGPSGSVVRLYFRRPSEVSPPRAA
jgi:anti-sigma regulatory factor (Ser/Thr protein kinase)